MKCAKVQEKNVTRRARYLFREKNENCWNLKKGTCIYFRRKKKETENISNPRVHSGFHIRHSLTEHALGTWIFACFFRTN